MTVNGRSVATVPHNEVWCPHTVSTTYNPLQPVIPLAQVVRLISASEGSCLVQILESGGSDSSSDGEEGRARSGTRI